MIESKRRKYVWKFPRAWDVESLRIQANCYELPWRDLLLKRFAPED
jgi:hypothetical protein